MTPVSRHGRLITLDLARTMALIGMVVFHFTLDLGMFGHIPEGTVYGPGWQIFARVIAGSFIFLSGASLFLAHGAGIRWPNFLRRLLILAASAAIVTLATYFILPNAYIFFGILHSIAVASIIGLAFLGLPALVTILAAAAVLITAQFVSHPMFDASALQWLGLGTTMPITMDFEPVFPWLSPFLLGIGAAKLLAFWGAFERLERIERSFGRLATVLAWPGRHSLAIYLCHQPILFGSLLLLARLRA